MRILCLDVENGAEYKEYKGTKFLDLSPFNPNNQLVSIGLSYLYDNPTWNEVDYYCINHSTKSSSHHNKTFIQNYLNKTDLLVGHYIKHDLKWLLECGFTYEGKIYDTAIAEYVLQRGIKKSFKLASLAEEHDLPRKKTDLIQPYLDAEISFYDIPWDIVEEYGRGDVITTCALYELQQERLAEYSHLIPTVNMMNEFLPVLVEMERNGVFIDEEALNEVERTYAERLVDLDRFLIEGAVKVMGDVPMNLDSPDFCSRLFFSRRVKDKKIWAEVFNIGANSRGKPKRPPLMNSKVFARNVRTYTELIKIQEPTRCENCVGTGHLERFTLKNKPYKKQPKCTECMGSGITYTNTRNIAGLRLAPISPYDTSASGFKANKETLNRLKDDASPFVKEYVEAFIERSAIGTYLSTFVEGIKKYKKGNILRTNLNQTITATGRLSSSGPNFQNMPRGLTFPIKKAFVSRFDGGTLITADYSGLEFRMAGHLSGCPSVRRYIDDNIDPHVFTRDFINNYDIDLPPITRQEAKSDTFKPLYGGTSGSPRQKAYYAGFLIEHYGVAEWHEKLKQEAVCTKMVRLPNAREYKFPYAYRMDHGYVNQTTQIVNYPVQGFATADVVPCGVIAVYRLFKKHGLRSLLILTVHDDLWVDVYPGERDIVIQLLREGLLSIDKMFKEFCNIRMEFPLEISMQEGLDAFNMEKVGEFTTK